MRKPSIILTIPVLALLTQPLWAPQWGAGILGEIAAFGPVGAVCALVVFFGLVALYCRTLARFVALVPENLRVGTPRSVWLMFAIPFNFAEDFFVVAAISASLRADGRVSDGRRRLWAATGLAWCGLQIASLFPGPMGVLSGVLALLVWAGNWTHAALLRRSLATTTASERETSL